MSIDDAGGRVWHEAAGRWALCGVIGIRHPPCTISRHVGKPRSGARRNSPIGYAITWTHDATDDAYLLITEDMYCRVWRMLGPPAKRRRGGAATSGYPVETVANAGAWGGQCRAERKVGT